MTDQGSLFPGPRCKKCGASILFIMSASGRRIPCEVEKTTVVLHSGDVVTGHVSHFATCPGADKMREPKTRERDHGERERRGQTKVHDMIAAGLGEFISRHGGDGGGDGE